MPEEMQYILMPASVFGLLKAEMVKEGIAVESATLALIKLGYLTAQETTRGEQRAKDFEAFKADLKGKLKSEGLGQISTVLMTKTGDLQITVERSIEAVSNRELKIKGRCGWLSGYLMGMVNAYIPSNRQYICKELSCTNDGNAELCTFELRASGKK